MSDLMDLTLFVKSEMSALYWTTAEPNILILMTFALPIRFDSVHA